MITILLSLAFGAGMVALLDSHYSAKPRVLEAIAAGAMAGTGLGFIVALTIGLFHGPAFCVTGTKPIVSHTVLVPASVLNGRPAYFLPEDVRSSAQVYEHSGGDAWVDVVDNLGLYGSETHLGKYSIYSVGCNASRKRCPVTFEYFNGKGYQVHVPRGSIVGDVSGYSQCR